MLDIVLDYFIKFLTKGILPDKPSATINFLIPTVDGSTPHHDDKIITSLVKKKRNMVEIMTELMQLLQPDSNIRQFDDAKFIDAIIQIIIFTSVNQ